MKMKKLILKNSVITIKVQIFTGLTFSLSGVNVKILNFNVRIIVLGVYNLIGFVEVTITMDKK